MQAEAGKTYVHVRDGIVMGAPFTDETLAEWNNDVYPCVEVPSGVTPAPGWTYADGTFTQASVRPVPAAVTPLQARKALTAAGLRAAADAAIQAAGQDAIDAWEYATEIQRTNPLVAGIASALNQSEADIDNLFRLAETL